MKNLLVTFSMFCCFITTKTLKAQQTKLTLDLSKSGVKVSPKLYGLMTEEINYSYDGGLYAELIRNRTFMDNSKAPDSWTLVEKTGGKGSIQLDKTEPVNPSLPVSLKLENTNGNVGVANAGYWGIPVRPNTVYKVSFYAKTAGDAAGAVTVGIESNDGTISYVSAPVTIAKNGWKKYEVTLSTKQVKATAAARFVINTSGKGTYWFNLVSLFPPTYKNTPNGNRIDLMELMADMKPAFLRFPGGNYLEGDYFSTRFDWKKTLGSLESRPGHAGPWGYRSTDGMGLLEFLKWCEDLKMEPLLAVFAGYTLKGDHLDAGPFLQSFVEEALAEIEYVTGDVNTKWGAQRAKDGHPEPFKLTYIEVGNEDGFDKSGSYEGRFTQFYNAIKAKYPKLQIISTVGGRDPLGERFKVKTSNPEVFDEHYYRTAWEMEEDATHYDNYDRNTPKIFVGEWATREGSPTTNMNAALGDAAWMTGMERNSDHVVMSCYAPLFVNVSPGAMQWRSDLIGYNALLSYGSPSYYAQKMFSNYLGDEVVSVSGENIPTQTRNANKKDSTSGKMPKPIPALFYVATKSTKTGAVYLKVVNASSKAQSVTLDVKGAAKLASAGTRVVLKSSKPEDTNSIDEPKKIIPVTTKIKGIKKNYTSVFEPYSITVLQLQTR